MKDRIKQVRIDAGLNQSEFAKRLNISQSAIGYYESGKKKPSADTLAAICTEFDVDGTWLLTGKISKMLIPGLDEHETLLVKALRSIMQDKMERR